MVGICHFCQTLTAAVVCTSLDISTERTPDQHHHRALQACIAGPPDNWRRRIGRPRQSWLRTVEADLQPGLATAKRRAQDRSAWQKLVATATSSQTRSWSMHSSTERGLAIACRLSVRRSVCDVGDLRSQMLEILETNCTDY